MTKAYRFLSVFLLIAAFPALVFAGGSGEKVAGTDEAMKIAFFVSDMSNVFHQSQYTVAKAYAKEKYGAEVYAFDGKSDSNVMTQNIDQLLPQGMDMATLHIWDGEAATPGVLEAIENGVVMATFFSPLAETGIPIVRSDEASVSYGMGVEMAQQWKAAQPDKPIVMVQLGWPNNAEVISGRTAPFVKGVLSVDPSATDLGCLDASKGTDATKQIVSDLVTQHPEVNLFYSEASHLTVGTMAALRQAGRGTMKDGKPVTEIVASVDFDEVEMKEVYNPESSLKLSMGLPPIETAQTRIDNLFMIKDGTLAQTLNPASETYAKAYLISYWSMSRDDCAKWLNSQFGTSIK